MMSTESSFVRHVYVEKSFTHEWQIENYEKLSYMSRRSEEFCITSQRLFVPMDVNKSVCFYLHLYPVIRQCPRINWSLIFCPEEIKECLMLIKFVVSIVTSDPENPLKTNGLSSPVRMCDSELISLGVQNCCLAERPDFLLPNGTLNLIVSGTLCTWMPRSSTDPVPQFVVPNLATHLADCLRKEEFSDVIISVGDKKFQCHKAILCARSPVFERMFKNLSLETINNTVKIEDIEPDVLEQIVHFIYTDTSPRLSEMPEKIIYGAEKYDLPLLKTMCINEMVTNMNINNAADYLVSAYTYNEPLAKERMLMFVRANAREIMNSEAWGRLQNDITFRSIAVELTNDVLSMLAEGILPTPS